MIPLFKPYMPEVPEMEAILHSGALAYGAYTKDFEEKLKLYFGSPYVTVTNSFNTAISVAITTLGLSCGDEVIASPMACLASTQPYASSGLSVRWCDIDPHTGTIDPEALRSRITSRTKAIIHNHFCGYVGNIDAVNNIGREYGIPVIDDGIECFGSEYKGQKVGNCGTNATVFSFTAVRIPNTIDGGAIVFKSKEMYERSLLIRDCGIDRKRFRDELGEISPKCDISEIGYSATMSNVNGYIGSMQMDVVNKLIKRQRDNAQALDCVMSTTKNYVPIHSDNVLPNYWVYGILSDNKTDAIRTFRGNNLYASGVHINNNIYSVFGDTESLSGVNEFYNKFVALPSGWWVEDSECYSNIKL